jgi:diguanylate cyclase (GGDEF)-like protein
MQALLPDPFTALAMTALAACTVAWVMWALGHSYWRKGLSLAAVSTVIAALAYGCAALSVTLSNASWPLFTALAFNAAIATLTLAIQTFRQQRQPRRDIAIVLLPMAATLVLDVCFEQQAAAMLQSAIYVLQTLFACTLLLRIRRSTPGRGWQWLTGALAVQSALALVHLQHAMQPDHPTPPSTPMAWLLQLLPMLVVLVSNVGFLVMLRDRESALEWGKAQRDPLTQLPNRAALVQHLQISIEQAAQSQQSMAIMVLDIDHFKSVNDSYGHLVGDQVIQSIARTLMEQARSADFSARYGGEEFVVVLPNTNAREAFHIADRLCQTVRKCPMQLPSGKLLHTTISIGVYAGNPTHGSSWERLVSVADEAMYRAKNNGRDRVFMSSPVQAMQSQAAGAQTL